MRIWQTQNSSNFLLTGEVSTPHGNIWELDFNSKKNAKGFCFVEVYFGNFVITSNKVLTAT